MTLSSEQIKIALEIWRDYSQADVTFINANQETTPDKIDQQRIEAIPQIKASIDDFLAGNTPLEEFKTTIEWQEKHKLLKVNFPVNIHNNEAVHEIQFGHIKRPNHRSRPFDNDRFEVANQKWTALTQGNQGFAVLNDCKYGVNVLGDSIAVLEMRDEPEENCKDRSNHHDKDFYNKKFHTVLLFKKEWFDT